MGSRTRGQTVEGGRAGRPIRYGVPDPRPALIMVPRPRSHQPGTRAATEYPTIGSRDRRRSQRGPAGFAPIPESSPESRPGSPGVRISPHGSRSGRTELESGPSTGRQPGPTDEPDDPRRPAGPRVEPRRRAPADHPTRKEQPRVRRLKVRPAILHVHGQRFPHDAVEVFGNDGRPGAADQRADRRRQRRPRAVASSWSATGSTPRRGSPASTAPAATRIGGGRARLTSTSTTRSSPA